MGWHDVFVNPGVVTGAIQSLAAIVVGAVGYLLGRKQANAVVEAEAVKLRHQILQRHVDDFYTASEDAKSFLLALTSDASEIVKHRDHFHVFTSLCHHAECALSPQHLSSATVVLSSIYELHGDLFGFTTALERDGITNVEKCHDVVCGYSACLLVGIIRLTRIVNLSIESRLYSRPPTSYRRQIRGIVRGLIEELREEQKALEESRKDAIQQIP